RLVDRDTTIGGFDRFAPAGRLGHEVVGCEKASDAVGVAHQLARHLAVIEAVPAIAGDRLQRPRKVGIFDPRAWSQEDRGRLRALGQFRARQLAPAGQPRADLKALPRVADGAVQAALEWQAAIGGVRHAPAGHSARNSERAWQWPAIGYL